MVSKELIVKSRLGLHARVATLLVKKASGFKSDIFIECEGKKANGKSIINVLALGANFGAKVKVIISGADEQLALEQIAAVIEKD